MRRLQLEYVQSSNIGSICRETLTVAQYFGRTYPNARLDPSLPVVKLGRTQYVPMDVVELVAGSVIPPTKLTGDQAANQIRVTAKKPAERQKQISDVRRDEKYESNTFAKAWGVEVSNEMLKLQGRVLTPPKVQYAPKSKIAAPRVNEGLVSSPNIENSSLLLPFLSFSTALGIWYALGIQRSTGYADKRLCFCRRTHGSSRLVHH